VPAVCGLSQKSCEDGRRAETKNKEKVTQMIGIVLPKIK
jgi:hypothetical protein